MNVRTVAEKSWTYLGFFKRLFLFLLIFFCLNKQNPISRIVLNVGNLNTKFCNRKSTWLEQLKHLPICCQNILCQFKSLLKSIKILSPQVKKIYEVLPKSINREIDEKEWKFLMSTCCWYLKTLPKLNYVSQYKHSDGHVNDVSGESRVLYEKGSHADITNHWLTWPY